MSYEEVQQVSALEAFVAYTQLWKLLVDGKRFREQSLYPVFKDSRFVSSILVLGRKMKLKQAQTVRTIDFCHLGDAGLPDVPLANYMVQHGELQKIVASPPLVERFKGNWSYMASATEVILATGRTWDETWMIPEDEKKNFLDSWRVYKSISVRPTVDAPKLAQAVHPLLVTETDRPRALLLLFYHTAVALAKGETVLPLVFVVPRFVVDPERNFVELPLYGQDPIIGRGRGKNTRYVPCSFWNYFLLVEPSGGGGGGKVSRGSGEKPSNYAVIQAAGRLDPMFVLSHLQFLQPFWTASFTSLHITCSASHIKDTAHALVAFMKLQKIWSYPTPEFDEKKQQTLPDTGMVTFYDVNPIKPFVSVKLAETKGWQVLPKEPRIVLCQMEKPPERKKVLKEPKPTDRKAPVAVAKQVKTGKKAQQVVKPVPPAAPAAPAPVVYTSGMCCALLPNT